MNTSPIKTITKPLKYLYNLSVILAFIFITSLQVASQNKGSNFLDSLKSKSYTDLYNLITINLNDSIKAKPYALYYLNKAKKGKDTAKTANAYTQLISIYGFNNVNKSIQYIDSLIQLTKNFKNDTYPGFGYLLKGMCYNTLGDYKKALHYYLIAQKYYLINKNVDQLYYVKNQIGQLKYFWGNYNEALEIYKKQLEFLEKNKTSFKEINEMELTTLFHLSNCYLLTKNSDSALINSNKGLLKSLKQKNNTRYYSFLSQIGEIYFHQNKLSQAHDSITKSLPYETSQNGRFNNHVILAKIFHKQQNQEKAFFHYQKADSLYDVTKDVVPEVRDVQEFFIKFYKYKNDTKNQLKYIDRLLAADSIMKGFNINLNETIHKEYETPILLSEKQKIITELKNKDKKSNIIILTLLLILLIALFFSFKDFQKEKKYKKRFENLLLEQKVEPTQQEEKIIEQNGISKDVLEHILFQLKNFEKNNSFADNSITLNSLALTFETNSNYLSKVINAHKYKNFSTYLTDLRIDYTLEKLKNDLTFRKFDVKSIAFEVGFNNAETFSKAFYKKTGIYPSFYIKQLDGKE